MNGARPEQLQTHRVQKKSIACLLPVEPERPCERFHCQDSEVDNPKEQEEKGDGRTSDGKHGEQMENDEIWKTHEDASHVSIGENRRDSSFPFGSYVFVAVGILSPYIVAESGG